MILEESLKNREKAGLYKLLYRCTDSVSKTEVMLSTADQQRGRREPPIILSYWGHVRVRANWRGASCKSLYADVSSCDVSGQPQRVISIVKDHLGKRKTVRH